ncbi:hypothetical protein BKA70DRAFT_1149673 [Coprinopsis sp. MPI-PUGE-AT-0042]|nr:hypothetical protein BKA70DRAFT_1149673 [Coprinopsis sp. MPI-PUGE-AT-0042]
MSVLEKWPEWYLDSLFARTVTSFGVAAIQVFMWIYMVSLLTGVPHETRRRRTPYIIVSLIILLLSSAASILEMMYIYTALLEATPGLEGLRSGNTSAISKNRTRFFLPAALIGDLAIRTADAVLVYRCYIVWFDCPWVVAPVVGLWLAGTAVGLRTFIPFSFQDSKLDAADIFCTVGINILVTILIWSRLVRARKRFMEALPHTDHKVYIGVIAVLVESAAPVAVFGTALAITSLLSSGVAWKVRTIFAILYRISSILAPQLVIFRVAVGSSWANKTEASAAISRSIAFTSQTDSDKENGDNEALSNSDD